MGYAGQVGIIQLGNGGLHTDDPQNKIPPTDLINATNIQLYHGYIEKCGGSLPYNQSPLPVGVVAIIDWWPDAITQRVIAVCRDGRVYRYRNGYLPFSEVTPAANSNPSTTPNVPATLQASTQTVMVPGGAEATGNPRKLFIFSGSTPQVIVGDGTTRRNLNAPAFDWAGPTATTFGVNQPYFGIVYRNALWCFGNSNNPHTAYRSSETDQEDFQSASAGFYTVDSGYSERLMTAFVYKSALYVVKYPQGLYQLIDSDPSPANWYFVQIQAEFGAASQHASAPVINDIFIANQNGMISSATAVLAFGNLKAGEVLYNLRNENYVRENMAQNGLMSRHSIYYSDKHIFMSTYQSAGGIKNDRILYIDLSNQQLYRVYWGDKDQANCLGLKKDSFGIQRPFYGSDDGFIYEMDHEDRNVNGNAYTMDFQTPHTDLGFIAQAYQTVGSVNQYIGDMTKIYDFLEIDYEPTGDNYLTVECILDGRSAKTLQFNLNGNKSNLDQFILDENNTDPVTLKQSRLSLGLSGRRISFRCTNSNLGENCRIAALNVYFRVSGQQAEGNK